MSKIAIGRPIEGISLNGREYARDMENNVLLFGTEEEARTWLAAHGVPEDAYEGMGLEFVELEAPHE